MTRDRDRKRLIRERMRVTGENYTTARAGLLGADDVAPPPRTATDDLRAPEWLRASEWLRAEREQARVVGRFVRDGRLVRAPQRRKARAAVLLHLVRLFEPGRDYPEAEVTAILVRFDADVAFWRRELVNYGYLLRAAGVYRLPPSAPARPTHLAQEVPIWEAIWLPGHLARPCRRWHGGGVAMSCRETHRTRWTSRHGSGGAAPSDRRGT